MPIWEWYRHEITAETPSDDRMTPEWLVRVVRWWMGMGPDDVLYDPWTPRTTASGG